MRHTAAAIGTAALAALALTGCTVYAGTATSEDREVGDVTAVDLRTSGDLTLLHGDRPMLTLTAPEDAHDSFTSDVKDGRLTLAAKGSVSIVGTLRYLLETDHVDEVTVSGSGSVTGDAVTGGKLVLRVDGSGDVTLTGIDAQSVDVQISGSGDVELKGRATEVTYRVEGSGNVHADELEARRATTRISGSGGVDVRATETLDATIEGSGDVTYSGDPKVTSDIEGSGDVEHS